MDEEKLIDGDFVYLTFLENDAHIGITTVFDADIKKGIYNTEKLSD